MKKNTKSVTMPTTTEPSWPRIASKTARPRPGRLKTVSVTIAPPSKVPASAPMEGDHRDEAVAEGVPDDDRPRGQPLGLRRPHVVGTHVLGDARPCQPRHVGQ